MIRTNTHAVNFLSSSPHERVIHFDMSGIQCPRCGRQASGGGRFWKYGKPYCSWCGWNADRVKTVRDRNQILATVCFAGFGLFLGVLGASVNSANPQRRIFIAFGFMVLLLVLIARFRSKSEKSSQTKYAATAPVAPGAFAMSGNASSIPYERLLMLRRPRTLRLKAASRIFAVALLLFCVSAGYGIFLTVEKGGGKADFTALPNLVPFAMIGLIWALIAITMFRSMLRDRSLLSEGEIAVATVTAQSYAGGESRNSRITYEFKDAAGRTFSGKCTDRTRKIFEEMQTPVFYDPTNPTKNIALVGATYDVVES
jgi:ribosomal protein L37E